MEEFLTLIEESVKCPKRLRGIVPHRDCNGNVLWNRIRFVV